MDENISVGGVREHDQAVPISPQSITISHCIIAEALHTTVSHGTLIEDFSKNISVIGNLYDHNYDRVPQFNASTTGVVANNLIFNATNVGIRLTKFSYVQNGEAVSPNVSMYSAVICLDHKNGKHFPCVQIVIS